MRSIFQLQGAYRIALLCAIVLNSGCAEVHEPVSPVHVMASAQPGAPAPTPGEAFQHGSPVFGLATSPDGSLLAAAMLAGVIEVRRGVTDLVAQLAGVSDVVAIGRGNLLAITAEPVDPSFVHAQKLFRISQGRIREVADLFAFETAVNPDQIWNPLPPESNPFGLDVLPGGRALIADAAGNSIVLVDQAGSADWVAVLTPRLASTAHFKGLIGCQPDDPRPPCSLPSEIMAQPVPTSIAVGPDGAYYAGELTGFPGTPGLSRIWRIAPGSLHVLCPSAACTLVVDGLTSIMDLAFAPDGTLFVAEFDAAGWLAAELGGFPATAVEGGRVQACNVASGTCALRAQSLSLPTAITVGRDGSLWVAENDAIPFGPGRIRALP